MAEIPPNQREDRFYKPAALWKWFGILSVLMLLATVWMVLDDFGREWKGYQREFMSLKEKKYQEQLEEAQGEVDQDEIDSLREQIKEQVKSLIAREDEREKLEDELTKLTTRAKNTLNTYQAAKGEWDVARYHFQHDYGHKYAASESMELPPDVKAARDKIEQELAEVHKLQNISNEAAVAMNEKKAQLKGMTADKEALEKQVKKLRTELIRLEKGIDDSKLTLLKVARSSPIIDLADPVFKVNQIVLPHIRDDLNFATSQKVDRCTTCHLAIDMKGFENEKQPFRTHPRLDLMLGSTSPHPIDKVGCTSCHDGRGRAIDFTRAAHTPQNPEQAELWKKKYHWHPMHHVPEKMLPLQYTEGKCMTCHKQTHYVPKGEKVNESIQLFQAAGCYGCHKVEGWEHIRKPAPSLEKIKGKVSRDWFVKWIRDPKAFNEKTRMPQMFHLSNMQRPEFAEYQEAEIFAITDYVYENSEGYRPNVWLGTGSARRGKELFGEVGCLGCHQVDDYPVEDRSRFGRAPDLSKVGTKVSAKWLNTWLRNPRHYWKETSMPSLRLSDSEIRHLTSYLLSKKNDEFDALPVGEKNEEVQRDLLKKYLLRDPKMAPATVAKVEKAVGDLSAHEVSLELGRRAIGRVGCYGCHDIKGFEGVAPIGVELTQEGSKEIAKLDFGLIHLPHTRYDWFKKKLEEPRIFDKGKGPEYLDTLRMPWFRFEDNERERLTMYLLGKTNEVRTAEAAKVLNAREHKEELGNRVMQKYNCQGCHIIQDLYVPMPEDHPDFDEDIEALRKYNLEGRILAHYLEDPTQGPPSLWGEGKKIRSDWVHSFLHKPYKLRVGLKVRMPSFQMSNDEVNTITEGWANAGGVEFPYVEETGTNLTQKEFQAAAKLFGKLQCTLCHFVGPMPATVSLEDGSKGYAPNLWESYKRLHTDWIVEWLRNPQELMPGTRMPGFWPDGNSPAPEILGGDSEEQMRVLAEYIQYLGRNKVIRK